MTAGPTSGVPGIEVPGVKSRVRRSADAVLEADVAHAKRLEKAAAGQAAVAWRLSRVPADHSSRVRCSARAIRSLAALGHWGGARPPAPALSVPCTGSCFRPRRRIRPACLMKSRGAQG